jgi:hypothetical protein
MSRKKRKKQFQGSVIILRAEKGILTFKNLQEKLQHIGMSLELLESSEQEKGHRSGC